MVHFIRLHNYARSEKDRDEILVNPENISYISPMKEEGSYIHFCSYGGREHLSLGISVMESLAEIEELVKHS